MMTRSTSKLLLILLFVDQSICIGSDKMSLSQVLVQYQTALQDLIAAHQQLSPNQVIDLTQNSLILSTYLKLIAPSVRWITGYANLVNSEVAHHYPYFTDLATLVTQYDQHAKSVGVFVALFPTQTQQAALNIFYESLTASVVQTCYNIVSNLAYQSNFDDATMTAAYQAYQLAWGAQTTTMTILGCASVADFQTNITQNMELLFQAAIKNVNIQLTQGMTTGTTSLDDFYKKLEGYYTVLSQVYKNSGDQSSAQEQQTLITQLKAQEQNYAKAQADVASADTQVATARSPIVLDVNNVVTVATSVQTSLKTLDTVAGTYTTAAGLYASAQDVVGKSAAILKANLINDNDILLRFIQQLWGMYLTDQFSDPVSGPGVCTFPELSGFVNQSSVASATSANAVQALTNLSGMISNQYETTNPVAGLFASSTLQNLTLVAALQNVKSYAQAIQTNSDAAKIDSMLDLKLVSHVQNALSILLDWCNSLIQAQSQIGQQTAAQQNLLAQAMTDAKELDALFTKHTNLTQYIPFFPDALATGAKTWQNFTAQFLVLTGAVSTAAQAMTLAGTVTASTSGSSSASNIAALTAQATTASTSAQKAEKAQNFSSASTFYQQAMNLYTQLYELEPYENLSQQMLAAAYLAKTKFMACSFAGIVQSSGAAALGSLTKVPTSYLAISYQLSFDAAVLMNGVVPKFLSTFVVGTPSTTLTAVQQQDLLAFIKGYLVAQYLADQGRTFTNYFNDYHMTLPMLQTSEHASDAMTQVSSYMNNFESTNIVGVTMTSTTAVTINLNNFPLSPVVPICSTLSSAGTYYSSAALLFAPGASNFTFGGNTYVPGNDATSANLMLQNMGYAYLSQAQSEMAQAQALMTQVIASLGSASSPLTQSIPSGFSDQFNKILNLCISAQALLFGSSTSANGYFSQAGLTSLATVSQQEYLKIYQQQIDFGKQCLVGDPTGNDYRYVVSSLNNIYVNWAAELTDPVKIAKINTDIAKLYETAGKKALNFKYEQPEFPGIKQIHYMVAAQYYCSVQAQYNYLNNSAKVAELTIKLNKMYYDACSQNMALYFNVKKNGASYLSSTTSEYVNISFDQLNSDIANYTGDPNESPLYTQVQNLLLNAAIMYEQLSNAVPAAAAAAAAGTTNPDHTTVLTWLGTQIDAIKGITNFALIPINLSEQIINLSSQAYTQFVVTVSNPAAFAAWNALLFSMIKNIYMMDYLGVTTTSTAATLATDTTQFLTALQNDTLSLSNPSAGYVQ